MNPGPENSATVKGISPEILVIESGSNKVRSPKSLGKPVDNSFIAIADRLDREQLQQILSMDLPPEGEPISFYRGMNTDDNNLCYRILRESGLYYFLPQAMIRSDVELQVARHTLCVGLDAVHLAVYHLSMLSLYRDFRRS